MTKCYQILIDERRFTEYSKSNLHLPPLWRIFDIDDDSGTTIFELQWHPTDDYFCCALFGLDAAVTYTTRGLLSLIVNIFNFLRLFAPATFYGKYIMQWAWLAEKNWDHPLPTDFYHNWLSFLNELLLLDVVKVLRYLNTLHGSPCTLLCFCDASLHGYAGVVYI